MIYQIIWITICCTILKYQNVFASNLCESNYNSCEECIVDSSKCVWCAEVHFNGTRCRSEKENLDDWCVGNTINPKSPVINIPNVNSKKGEVVQIKPQNIKIDLRPGDSIDFDFSIKLVRDYPVDLYFLVLASEQMREVKQKISDDSFTIYETMKNITPSVFFGTGTFKDKKALPFTNLVNNTAYSFQHRLKLTNKYKDFQETVNATWFGSNTNIAEGTLDALSQVLTCKDIGWNNESTKIIIVLTYGPFRSAGNANWAGIYRPYDGKCYLKNGIYENELKMDYPSVSIINRLAAEKEIKLIFIVGHNKEYYYTPLDKAIKGLEISKMEKGKFSIVEDLKKHYENKKQYLKLKVNMDPTFNEHINYTFVPDCYQESNLKECQIHFDEEKKFRGKLTLLKNIEADNVDIDILAEGIKERLNLNINIINTCNCSANKNSTECNSVGTLKCGKCECNEDRRGKKCECDKKSTGMNPNDDDSTCVSPTSSDKIKCSGHGACDCGECSCIDEDYTGSYCQCHKNMCPQYNDLMCSGHGKCICGDCICNADFTGKDCRFSMAKDNCMDGDTECNNRGTCIYNNCECSDPSAWDARRNGDLCQPKCSEKSCQSHQCQLLEPIVLCYLYEGVSEYMDVNITGIINLPGNYSAYDRENDTDNDSKNATDNDYYTANVTANYTANATANHWHHCPNVKTGLGCYTAFLYQYNEDSYGVRIKVQTNANCAESYYKYGGICAGLLIASGVIGLITWKCITSMRDKREYERFVEEARIIGFTSENPLYAPTTTAYSNPGFRKRSYRRKSSR